MRARLALVGSFAAFLLVPSAPADAHVVSCASSRLFAAERVVILKQAVQATSPGTPMSATLGSCLDGARNHYVTWHWTLTLTVPGRTIQCNNEFYVFAATHTSALRYRHKSRACA